MVVNLHVLENPAVQLRRQSFHDGAEIASLRLPGCLFRGRCLIAYPTTEDPLALVHRQLPTWLDFSWPSIADLGRRSMTLRLGVAEFERQAYSRAGIGGDFRKDFFLEHDTHGAES